MDKNQKALWNLKYIRSEDNTYPLPWSFTFLRLTLSMYRKTHNNENGEVDRVFQTRIHNLNTYIYRERGRGLRHARTDLGWHKKNAYKTLIFTSVSIYKPTIFFSQPILFQNSMYKMVFYFITTSLMYPNSFSDLSYIKYQIPSI